MSYFEIVSSIAKDVASEAMKAAEKCIQTASGKIDDICDKVAEKTEYYIQKEDARCELEEKEAEYKAAAIQFAEKVASSKVSSSKFYLMGELKDFRAIKKDFEQYKKEYNDKYGDESCDI